MTDMEDALRSCMEQLLIAREEREQIIVEAASEISSQQKKVHDLQHNLEVANKKAAKLATENNSLRKAMDATEKLARELQKSKAASDEQLADATAKLDAVRKQGASLQYEARMLQKELEIRSQEREYDLKSVDAARAQQAENLKKIAQLEAECQRLRTMVRKRLPGPAALAKMRDEVEQQPRTGGSPRRQRSATPMSPRSVTPRRASSEPAENGAVTRLRAIEDENMALKRALAARDTELQLVQKKYAEEVCKLSVVQSQLNDLAEESKRLRDANGQSETEPWASALVSELDHFKKGRHVAASVMVSDMSLLNDFAEIERLEMASGDQTSKPFPLPTKALRSATLEKYDEDHVPDGRPGWVQEVWGLVTRKHEATGESVDAICEEVLRALDQSDVHANGDASDALYDQPTVQKMVTNLIDRITDMIRASSEDNVARSGSLPDRSEFFARLEYLIHVCHDVLQRKSKLENLMDEVCLILDYIVRQYFSKKDRLAVDDNTKTSDRDELFNTVNSQGEHGMKSAKLAAAPVVQIEADKEPVQSAEGSTSAHILVTSQENQLSDELARVTIDQDDDIEPGRKSSYYEIESPHADGSAEDFAQQQEIQLPTNSDISAAADRLAECQETITILSKQLRVLKSLPNSGPQDTSMYSPRPSSADYRSQSLASIIAKETAIDTADGPMVITSPAPRRSVAHRSQLVKHGDPADAAPPARRSVAQEQSPYAAALIINGEEESTENGMSLVLPEPRRGEVMADPRKKKRIGQSLLGRIIFRKKVEGP